MGIERFICRGAGEGQPHLFLNFWRNGHRLKNSQKLSYNNKKNKRHHRVRRPLISKYCKFSAKLSMVDQEYLLSILSDFD